MSKVLLVCLFFNSVLSNKDEIPTVKLSSGSIRGKPVVSVKGKHGYAFLGIPMTQPPIGELRFRKPVPISPWNDTIDCFQYRSACPQQRATIHNEHVNITEDCLHVNVFTSRTCLKQGNCSVLVFLHGGGNLFQSPASIKEEKIINNFANEDRNIVFVSLPYRLGILSFLNLAYDVPSSIDSNLPIRDVLFGLQLIQREISYFGGDKNRVTIMGNSAGAELIVEIILSQKAENLFNQAVIISYLFVGDRNHNSNKSYSRKFSAKLNCSNSSENFKTKESVEKVLSCLRKISWKTVLETQQSFENDVEEINGVWVDGKDGVFPATFKELMNQNLPRKNYMIGAVASETKQARYIFDADGTVNQTKLDELCTLLAFEYNFESPTGFIHICMQFYGTVEKAADITDDAIFYYPAGRLADKFSENGNVYVYSFEYPIYGEKFQENRRRFSPLHGDDLDRMIYGSFINYTEQFYQIEEIYSGIVVNFVNTGTPFFDEQKWEKWDTNKRNYFVIDFDDNMTMPGMKDDYYKNVKEFYDYYVPMIAGSSRLPIDLPTGHDNLFSITLFRALVSEWSGISHWVEKNIKTALKEAYIWKEHVKHLQKIEMDHNHLSFLIILPLVALSLIGILLHIRYKRKTDSPTYISM